MSRGDLRRGVGTVAIEIRERVPAAPEMPRWPVENPAVTATARALPSCPTPGRSFR
ncbi:MAG: hypothetical protein ACLT1A_10260 [Dysosmobacter sp.]